MHHPIDKYLKEGRIPHIWCSGCGLGIALTSFVKALQDAHTDYDKVVVVSGIGCTGRIAGYLDIDSYHTTHGRAIPFAIGLKLAKPELLVFVFSGDGDLFAIGGNHFIHAARRNIDLKIICVNNFNYGMTGGQLGPTTPLTAKTSTTPYGNFEHPFNLVELAAICGAVYVARWTVLHARHLKDAIVDCIRKKGFTFIEVLSPCPTGYGKPNKLGEGIDELKFYQKNCLIKHFAQFGETEIEPDKPIVVGKFRDIEKPTFSELYDAMVLNIRKNKEEK